MIKDLKNVNNMEELQNEVKSWSKEDLLDTMVHQLKTASLEQLLYTKMMLIKYKQDEGMHNLVNEAIALKVLEEYKNAMTETALKNMELEKN